MRSVTVTVVGITAVVHSRTRRTPIVEAQYKQAIVKAHPEIGEYEQTWYELAPPLDAVDSTGRVKTNLTPEQAASFLAYSRQLTAVQKTHAVGESYASQVRQFVPLLARITDLAGTAFDMTPPQFLDSQVNAAFEDWLDETHEPFWEAIDKAITQLDAPLTPVEQRPPETLTEEQRDNPLSVEVA